MKIRLEKIPKKEQLFFIIYIIYMFFSVLNTSFYWKYFKEGFYAILNLSCLLLLAANELIWRKICRKEAYGIAVCMIFCIVIFLNSKYLNNPFFFLIAFVYVGRKIDFRRIVKFSIVITSIAVCFVIVSAYIGIIQNYIYISPIRKREYLGFRYALYPAAYLSNITAGYIYLKKEKITIVDSVVLIGLNSLMYWKTVSRLSAYMSILLILGSLVFKFFPKILPESKLLHLVIGSSYITLPTGSLLLALNYDPSKKWMLRLNKIFMQRLEYSFQSLQLYGIRIWGNYRNIEWYGHGLDENGLETTERILYVDNAYISVLQRFGVIAFVIMIILMTFTVIKCFKKKDYYLAFILFFVAGRYVVDDLFLYISYNTFLFAVGNLLMERGKNDYNPMFSKKLYSGKTIQRELKL